MKFTLTKKMAALLAATGFWLILLTLADRLFGTAGLGVAVAVLLIGVSVWIDVYTSRFSK